MHPARSLILFTTLSGLGFGLLAFLGLKPPHASGWVAAVFFAMGFLLAGAGLIASTFHLGRPERALRAFTQWQTSWLSREAWLAAATLSMMAVHGALVVFADIRSVVIGAAGAALALGTVYATSMIYAQLRTVPRWHGWLTPVHFLSLALAGGGYLAGETEIATVLIGIAGIVQLAHWRWGDGALARSGTTLASATGLGERGAVRAFEPPHTGPNYLMREMIHVVGRKHALKLRSLSLVLMAVLPLILLMLPFSHGLAALIFLSHFCGVLISRWLFFAEAEHVVGLYYGAR